MERNNLDLSGFPRLEDDRDALVTRIERDAAWSHLGWVQHDACKKRLRRQRVEKVLQGICIAMGVFVIALVILVAARP